MAMKLGLCFVLLTLPAGAQAATEAAHYVAFAAGLNVIAMEAQFDVEPSAYRLQLGYRTTGTLGFFVRSEQVTTVTGGFVAGRAVPQRLVSSGVLRGEQRRTEIDYLGGEPEVRALAPPIDKEREPVPEAMRKGTIDTLSAMAQLMAQVTRTGRCDGTVRTFDGRRLATLQAWTVGTEVIPPSSISNFSGPALHCEFEGRQIGGFMLDEDRAKLQQPQRGSAWFAAVRPGETVLPVRISFRTRWFGDATMYIAAP